MRTKTDMKTKQPMSEIKLIHTFEGSRSSEVLYWQKVDGPAVEGLRMPDDALSRELQGSGAKLILDEFVDDNQVFFFVEFPDYVTRQSFIDVYLGNG